jgi:lipopolysaccharide/colanic/teichoic acid biosynthesis glycosyltransferase
MPVSNLAEQEYIHLHTGVNIKTEQQKGYLLSKRFMDIGGAIFGMIVLSLIYLLVAVIIKIEDPKGPVIFTQKRVGKNGKEFKMYKFRSMVTDAESKLMDLLKYNETTGAMFKMKDDPRVTRIGRLIRKTSIDELPQLWNVLKGDMSLVGPRPPLLREVLEYSEYDKQRLLVVPGCTGLWQVSGRSELGFKDMLELDLHYIAERNIWFDIKLIIKTVLVLFSSKGAY